MTQPAYIYARFSSAEQAKGHSLERQLEEGRAYVLAQGWLHDETRELTDKGRSAYSGRNRAPGSALYEFEQQAERGHFSNGVVLAVENIDRLTRQGHLVAIDLVRKLTGQGVTVAIWYNQRIFKAYQDIDEMQVIELVLLGAAAKKIQEEKGKRVRSAWEAKHKAAQEGSRVALTGVMPGWLRRDPETGKPVPIPHRVNLLNFIYDSYIEGKGLPWIEKHLNGTGEPTWGLGKHGAKPWHVASINRYLQMRQVLGEYRPAYRQGDKKVNKGIVIPDFYPQVISPEKFNRAQAARSGRKGWGGNNKGLNFHNLLTGIATCGHCGGRVHQHAHTNKKGNGPRVRRSYLICNNARRGFGCSNKKLIRYERLETAILDNLFLLAVRPDFLKPSEEAQRLKDELAERERLIGIKRQEMAKLEANLRQIESPSLMRSYVALEQEVEADGAELANTAKALQTELGKGTPTESLDALFAARSALQSEDDEARYAARVKTHQALKRLCDRVVCFDDGTTEIIVGKGGLLLAFDNEGNQLATLIGQGARFEGPDGEPNWHPDREAAE